MKKTVKNTILKGITWCMAVLFIVSVTAIDSPSIIPKITCMASLGWLLLFMLANIDSKVTVQDVLCGWGE